MSATHRYWSNHEFVEIRNSGWKYVLLLLGSLVFVALGLFMVAREGITAMNILGLGFFGTCAMLFVWQLIDMRPRIVISTRGILDRTLGVGIIRWEDIQGAYVQSIQGNDFVCLVLRDPEIYLERLSPTRRWLSATNRALGFTDLNINLSGVNARTYEVLEVILKRSEAARSGALPPDENIRHLSSMDDDPI